MKVSFGLLSLLSVLALTPAMALADPSDVDIYVYCPTAQGSVNVIANYGDYIAGNGEAMVGSSSRKTIYFKSTSPLPSNMPTKFINYHNEKVEYDSTTGRVSCTYTSFFEGEPAVDVSYTLTNGKGGIVVQKGVDNLFIRLPLGLI